VHLFGQTAAMDRLRAIAERHGLPLIEDAAQAIFARTAAGPAGGLGAAGCFSFFPAKNLGALGDAGLVTTNDPAVDDRVRMLRTHGGHKQYEHIQVGGNFRIDALQAAILRIKLPYVAEWTRARRENAARYDARFTAAGLPADLLTIPPRVGDDHVFNQYVIRTARRDELKRHLGELGIASMVYYPTPLHRQPCFRPVSGSVPSLPEAERAALETLALPVFPTLGAERLGRIADAVIGFLK
jgi:dTDP-4-amino-4,6-dideoxygalactose transaminase